MREPNLIEFTSTREMSRIIQYLDPDFQENKSQGRRPHADFEGVIMLILLLGGVITCFVVMILHVSE
jgi:hypothetical protein